MKILRQGIKDTPAQFFYYEFCKTLKNTSFVNIYERLLPIQENTEQKKALVSLFVYFTLSFFQPEEINLLCLSLCWRIIFFIYFEYFDCQVSEVFHI